eukprot:3941967-Rhodomonas_salina.3
MHTCKLRARVTRSSAGSDERARRRRGRASALAVDLGGEPDGLEQDVRRDVPLPRGAGDQRQRDPAARAPQARGVCAQAQEVEGGDG